MGKIAMPRMMLTYKTVDEYIASFPPKTKTLLKQFRKLIRDTVPKEATEKISYGIPTFVYRGVLLHFASYKTHLGFYPGSGPVADFTKDLKAYDTTKGTIRLPLDKPLPVALLVKIIKACVKRNQSK